MQSRFNNGNDQHNTKASLTTKGITCKQSCSIFIKKKFKEPLANNRLRRLGVKKLDNIKEIHSLSFRMTKETKLSIFQFKGELRPILRQFYINNYITWSMM